MPIVTKILDALAWPIVALIAILVFKDQIRGLLDRLQLVKLKDYFLGFGPGAPDKEQPPLELEKLAPGPKQAQPQDLPTDKLATLFWLANDIMWVQDMLFRGAPSKAILAGLKNSQ